MLSQLNRILSHLFLKKAKQWPLAMGGVFILTSFFICYLAYIGHQKEIHTESKLLAETAFNLLKQKSAEGKINSTILKQSVEVFPQDIIKKAYILSKNKGSILATFTPEDQQISKIEEGILAERLAFLKSNPKVNQTVRYIKNNALFIFPYTDYYFVVGIDLKKLDFFSVYEFVGLVFTILFFVFLVFVLVFIINFNFIIRPARQVLDVIEEQLRFNNLNTSEEEERGGFFCGIHCLESSFRSIGGHIERLTRILENLPVGFFIASRDGQGQYVNETYSRFVGCLPEELYGQRWSENIYPDDHALMLSSWQRSVHHFEKFKMDVRYRSKDRLITWYSCEAQPVVLDSGKSFFSGVIIPIEEQKKIEERLSFELERLRLVIQAAEIGFWDWDQKNGRIFFSEKWATMLGYSVNDFEGKLEEWKNLVHPEDLPSAIEELTKHFEGESPIYQTRFRMRCQSGEWMWILTIGKVIKRDLLGNPVHTVGIHLNINEQVEKESKLENFLEIINSTPNPIIQISLDGKISFINKIGPKFYRFSKEEMEGLSIKTLMEKQSLELFENALEEVIQTKKSKEFTIYQVRGDKSHVCVRGLLFPSLDVKQEVKSVCFLVRELLTSSEIKQKENYFQQIQSEFVSFISHQLRTPLSIIKNSLEGVLEVSENLPEDLKDLLVVADKNAKKLSDLIHNVLDFQVIGLDSVFASKSPVNIKELLEKSIQAITDQSLEKGLSIQLFAPKPVYLAVVNEEKMLLVFRHLLENGLRYTHEGGIKILLENVDEGIQIAFQDTGIGVKPEDQEKIFTPFFQIQKLYTDYSTGLGLAIARVIVETHGGTLSCESEPGKGSTFRVFIPQELEES